jgi:hypothetical protein
MKTKPILAALALAAAGCATASAQELSYSIKYGGGLALTGSDAQNSRAMFDFALAGEWGFRPGMELYAEFGYRYFAAAWTERTPFTDTTGKGYEPAWFKWAVGYSPDAKGFIFNQDPRSNSRGAVDMRRDSLESWGVNLGWRRKASDLLPLGDLYFQGGLLVNFMVHQQEIIGDIRVYDKLPDTTNPETPDPVTPTQIHKEGLNFTPAVHSISPGLFAGAQWRSSRHFFSEVNLCWMTYSTVNYVPLAYTGKAAFVEDGSDSKLTVEFNFGFRF